MYVYVFVYMGLNVYLCVVIFDVNLFILIYLKCIIRIYKFKLFKV